MKAVVRKKYGPPDVLSIQEVSNPVPRDHEVLIRVHATTVNRTDCAVVSGKPWIMRLIFGIFSPAPIPGTDFAGVVESVGKSVRSLKVGDRVFGFDDGGASCSHAAMMTFHERKGIALIPEGLIYEQAAACAEGAHYARNVINKVNLKPGQKVLINGATGAIGSALLQFTKYLGVYTTAVCDTKNIELVTSLGADKVIDYLKEDFTRDEEKYDYVFDAVGKSTFGKCKHLLLPRGVYISSELGPWIQNPLLALITAFAGSRKVKFPFPYDVRESLRFVSDLVRQGKFTPVIDREYPMSQIKEAYAYVANGVKTGNVIIRM
jgi:NADPH:quinone reductase-like Zn-dependent oxidoreductase